MARRSVGNLNILLRADRTGLKSDLANATRDVKSFASRTKMAVSRGFALAPMMARGVRAAMPILTRFVSRSTAQLGKLAAAANPIQGLIPSFGQLKTAGTLAFAGLAGWSVKLAGDMEQTRIAFRVMIGDAKTANRLIEQLREFSAATPFQSEEVLGAARQLLAYGFAADEAVGVTRQLGDVAAALKIPLNDMSYLFGTLRAQGRAYAIDIRQFAMRGIPIYEELAKVMGINQNQVKKFVEEGKVGFHEVARAFENMTSAGGRFHGLLQEQSRSFLGLVSTWRDNLSLLLTDIGIGIIEEAGLKGFTEGGIAFLKDLRANLERIRPVIRQIAQFAKGLFNALFLAGKQLAAGIRTAIDLMQALFPTAFRQVSSFSDMVNNMSLTWNQARVNAFDFFEVVLGGVGDLIDALRRIGSVIERDIGGSMMAVTARILEAQALIPGGETVGDALKGPRAKFLFAEHRMEREAAAIELAPRIDLRAFEEFRKSFVADFEKQAEAYADALEKFAPGRAKLFREAAEERAKFAGFPIGRKDKAEADKQFQLMRRQAEFFFQQAEGIKTATIEAQQLRAELDKLEGKEPVEPKFGPDMREFVQKARQRFQRGQIADAISTAMQAAVGLGGPVGNTTPITDALAGFKLQAPAVPIQLEARGDELQRQFINPLEKFRQKQAELAELYFRTDQPTGIVGGGLAAGMGGGALISRDVYSAALAGEYRNLRSSMGLDNQQTMARLPEAVLSESAEAISDRLTFETFGRVGDREQEPVDVLKAIERLIEMQLEQDRELAKKLTAQSGGDRLQR